MTEHVESCCLSGHPLSPPGRLDGNCVMTCTCQQRATPPAEPTCTWCNCPSPWEWRWTEAEIRAAFAAEWAPEDAGPMADCLMEQLRAAVESPAQPPTTHVDNGYGDCIGCGLDDETGNSRSSSADCHVQRGADTPQPHPAETTTRMSEAEFRRLREQRPPEQERCETTIGGHPSGAPMQCVGIAGHRGPHSHPACEPSAVRGADVPTTEPTTDNPTCTRCGHPWDDHNDDGYCDTSPDDGHTMCPCPGAAGTSPTTPEERHEYFGLQNSVTGEWGNCAHGLNVPEPDTSAMCGKPYHHPIHQRLVEHSGWENTDVTDFLARDRAQRAGTCGHISPGGHETCVLPVGHTNAFHESADAGWRAKPQ